MKQIRVSIEHLEEPKLVFGGGHRGVEPRKSMAFAGAFDADLAGDVVRLGLVGARAEIRIAKEWLSQLSRPLVAREGNSRRYCNWPGAKKVFGLEFIVEDRFVVEVSAEKLSVIVSRHSAVDQFEPLLDLFDSGIQALSGDIRPDCIIVCLPDYAADLRITNPNLSISEQAVMRRIISQEESDQYSLFEPTSEEVEIARQLSRDAECLTYRTFYRALKARIMVRQNAVPVQFVRRDTFQRLDDGGHSRATRAWNLANAIFYKSGRQPWRPSDLPKSTCFVGVSFHHLRKRAGHLVYASVAQAFSSQIEPFALKGAVVPHDQQRDLQPFLSRLEADTLLTDVLTKYRRLCGSMPSRVVIHKSSIYQPEEVQGFREASSSVVPVCDLVSIRETSLRLIRRGADEPLRGTYCVIGDDVYLFTMGYVPAWREYPGPHVPAPLQINAIGSTDLRQRAREILALTKMNWNSTEGIDKFPITLGFARRVGRLMTELAETDAPNPSYRFYM